MALMYLLRVNFVSGVTWPSILDCMARINEAKKEEIDELEMMECRRVFNEKLRHMFVLLDEDAEHLIIRYMNKARKSMNDENEKLNDQYDINFLKGYIAFAVAPISTVMHTQGILPNKILPVTVAISLGCVAYSMYMFKTIMHIWKGWKSRPIPKFPHYLKSYLIGRGEFARFTQTISSSSHPHLFKYLPH